LDWRGALVRLVFVDADGVAAVNGEGRGRKKHHGLLDFNDIVKLRSDNFLPIVPTATACA
jgi:hypothetical protein